jgi:hypothetical protein
VPELKAKSFTVKDFRAKTLEVRKRSARLRLQEQEEPEVVEGRSFRR